MADLSHIRGVIWDLDGTLYRYNHYFKEACNIACARTVLELGLDMTYDDALCLARQSEREHGNSFKFFAAHGIRYEDYHHPFHAKIDHLVLEKNEDLKNSLEKISMPMTVLTNASRDWALRTLGHLGMRNIFSDELILALEDVSFKAKAYHTDGFDLALSRMGIKADDAMVVEDLPRNLLIPKQMGMTTALVHHDDRPEKEDAHVDHAFDDTIDVIKLLI